MPVTAERRAGAGMAAGTIGNIGTSAVLMASADALVGLRNGALELYREPVTFVVTDPDTNTIYKWKPAVGVAELKSHESAAKLTLGIQLGDSSDPMGPHDRDREGHLLLDQSAHPARRAQRMMLKPRGVPSPAPCRDRRRNRRSR